MSHVQGLHRGFVLSLLVLTLAGLVATAVSEAAPATANFTDLPVAETAFDGDLPQVGAVDSPPLVFALPDGRVVVLGLEDFKLKEMVSFDGGATFAGEAVVAGGPGGREILGFDASSDGLGRLAVALLVADPAGDRGLQFVHSSDFGQTWSDPRDLVVKGDSSHGVETLAISAAPEGRIAIAYMSSLGGGSGDPYAVVSDDSGATWTIPVRLNSDQAALTSIWGLIDVEVDPSGRPQVVWSLYEPDAGYALFASRSLNAGLTFEPPVRLDDLVTGGPVGARSFDLGLSGDGGIVVGFVNTGGGVHALLSPDGGATFVETLYYPTYTGRSGSNVPRVITNRSTPVVLLTLSTTSRLFVFNSPNGGAGFAGPATVTTTLARRTAPAGTFTPAGHWALAWMDVSGDPLARQIYDIFVSVSADGGVSWGPRVRVDTDPPGSAMSQLGKKGIAASGVDDLVLAYADGRDDGGGSANLYFNRSGASALDFSMYERRIDAEGPLVAPNQSAYADSAVATDGASHVYHAFTVRSPGPREDLYLAVSSDRGETFGPIARLGDSAPGEAANSSPQLRAFPDGRVYLAYLRLNPDSGEYEIRFNRSDDYGSSWQPSDVLIGISWLYGWAMDATPLGLVHVAFSDPATGPLVVASSRDRGETFDFSTLGTTNGLLSLCAQGEQVIVAGAYDGAFVSEDGGASWSDPAPCGAGNANDIHVACNGQGGALVTCTTGAPDTPPFARRYHAEAGWSPDQTVSGSSGSQAFRPRATFSSAGRAVVVWEDLAPGVYAALSTDGGETFPSFLRLDDHAPEPRAISYAAQIVADGAGNLFTGWVDGSAGALSVATRASRDGGATWGPVYRVDREMPQGSRENWYQWYTTQNSAALPGRGFFAWESRRESYNRKALFNAYDLTDIDFDDIPEDDGDGSVDPCQAGSAEGCDDNCAAAENPDQADADGDGIGDACDACGLDPANDGDADQVCGNVDNCPERANPDQRDGDGNGLGDVCDEPRVAAISPGDNATGVPVFVNVTLAFVEPVAPETVGDVDGDGTSDTVLLLADSVPVSGTVTVGPDGLTATFNPDDPLVPSTLYEVRATAGIEDLQERSLTPFTSLFETSASDQPAAENLGDAGEPSRGTQQDEQYGSSLGSAGDVNGDGLSDWLVGAPGYDTSDKADSSDAGRVLLFLGSTDEAERSRPDVVFVGGLIGERLGSAVGSGEDLNGDGIPDLLLGAEQTDPSGLDVRGPGRAYLVYFDPADFPDLGQTPEPYEVEVADAAAVVFVGTTDGDRAGHSVSLSPDVNGDGVADLLIGAPGTDRDGLVDRGASYLVLGGQPLPSTVELSHVGLYEAGAVNGIAYLGGSPGDGLGWSVSAAEDFDGDGRADVLLGAPFRDVELATSVKQAALDVGSAYLDCGPKSGTFSRGVIEVDGIIFDGRVTLEIVGDQAGQNLGYAVALTGDHDGDHTADAFVGAPGSDVEGQEDAGEAFFIVNAVLREKRGVIEVDRIRQPGSSAGAAYQGSAAGDQTGFSVGDGGDVNGDGVDDALIGAPGADVEADSSAKQGLLLEEAGETYLDYGTTSQLLGRGVIEVDSIGASRPGVIYRGENAGDRSGSAVAGVGDADGDGQDNVAIGAPSADADTTPDAGASYLVTAPAPISDGSTSCGPAGCIATDLDTGAQLEIPPESLADPARVRIDGITDVRELPAPVPSGRGFVGGADLDPDGLDFDLPHPALTLPVDPLVQDQLTAGESLPLAYFDGSRWVMSGGNGLVGPNPKYPERLAVSGPIDSLHTWCATFPDLDGDGIRDERDDDRDGDGVLNASDNCPSLFNPDQADRDGDGTGDACEAIFAPLAPPDGMLVYRGRPETFSWSWPHGEATFGVFWSSTASARPLPPFVQSPAITSLSYTPTAAEWKRILELGCSNSERMIFWRVAGTFDRKTLIGLVRTLVLAEPDQVCAKR